MFYEVTWGILIPLIGTTLGAACVYFMKDGLSLYTRRVLLGFASGVMVAASVWSLLIPSIDMATDAGGIPYIPALTGTIVGFIFLLITDNIIPHLHLGSNLPEGPQNDLTRSAMLVFAVVIHNIPEGMAVGVVFAGMLECSEYISMAAAFALSIGIAIQNFPEGAIISMPLRESGVGKHKAFFWGFLSGVVEPIGAIAVLLFSSVMTMVLPYFLAFAAGAMLYVVVEELIPEASLGVHSNHGTMGFCAGFVLMMVLDVALG